VQRVQALWYVQSDWWHGGVRAGPCRGGKVPASLGWLGSAAPECRRGGIVSFLATLGVAFRDDDFTLGWARLRAGRMD